MGKIGIISIGVLCFLLLSCQKDKLETASLEIKGETLCLKNEEPTKFYLPRHLTRSGFTLFLKRV